MYYYVYNLQGDVTHIIDASKNIVDTYQYDAWGKILNLGALSEVGNANPFRYRGYYYDNESGLYYLNSRYYNAEWGRFINADGVVSGVGGPIQGYNLFAYCMNNPVNLSDEAGDWPSWNDIKSVFKKATDWVDNNIIQPVAGFFEDVVDDFNNYDSNNLSEDIVFSSNYFSNYKGAVVVKTPFDASFSFGFIGLSKMQQNSNTLKHEYGHTVQLENMGMGNYIANVAVPSITINILSRQGKLPYDYYSYPWEAEANKLGGATLSDSLKPPLPQGGYTSYWDLIQLFF